MDHGIVLYRDGTPSPLFSSQLLYHLVAHGARYNARILSYRGFYMIISDCSEEDVDHFEEDEAVGTEKIADILARYREYNPQSTSLTVYLDVIGEYPFYMLISLVPVGDCETQLKFTFRDATDDEAYTTFITLCSTVFDKFNYTYGAYWSDRRYPMSRNRDEPPAETVTPITIYSKEMVEEIGRERVLSAPAHRVEQLNNGGVLLVACLDRGGDCPEVETIKRHFRAG